MRIVFVRHGEPDYERDCLTEAGKRQAEAAAERLLSENITEIWASPLGRAAETAEYASKTLKLPVKTLDFMREVTWGNPDDMPIYADGHPWDVADELARRGLNLNDLNWRNHEYFRNNRVLECVDSIETGIDEWLSGLGYKRNGYGYEHTIEEESHKTVALFSHGGSSCAAISHILNLPFPFACALLHLEFTSLTILRFDKKKGPSTLPCLELANDGKHIHEGFYHRLNEM